MNQKKKIVKGFFLGVDHDNTPQFAPIGEMGTEEAIELIMSVLYDIMHIPLKFGISKEEIYDFAVENFSLMVDKYLPEKAEMTPQELIQAIEIENKAVQKLAEEKRSGKS